MRQVIINDVARLRAALATLIELCEHAEAPVIRLNPKLDEARTALHSRADKALILSKVTEVKLAKPMLNLEQLEDGTWRLIYSTSLIPDLTKITGFTIEGAP